MRRFARLLLVLILLAWTGAPRAQERLEDNHFAVDAVLGPVLGSSRILGLGGAYTAIAEGIGGVAWNPASVASRSLFEFDWFEWDLSISLFVPGVFGQTDFFNNGEGVEAGAFVFANVGLRLQFGRFGLGLISRIHTFKVDLGTEVIDINLLEGHLDLGYAFGDGQVVVGVGVRGADLDMRLPSEEPLVHFTGAGLEAGFLLRLADQPWRLGLAGRLPVESRVDSGQGVQVVDGVEMVRDFVLPEKVYMPWEIQVGFAWEFGSRLFNWRWREPDDLGERMEVRLERKRCERRAVQVRHEWRASGRSLPPGGLCPDLAEEPEDPVWWEREMRLRRAEDDAFEVVLEEAEEYAYWRRRNALEALSRQHWLVSAEVLFIGPTANGIGMDGFLEQERRDAGERFSVGFRLGAETELVDNRLKVRAGFYLEPPRLEGATHRPHGTAGFDVRLFRWDIFGLFRPFDLYMGMTCDLAPGWVDLGIGIGFWH